MQNLHNNEHVSGSKRGLAFGIAKPTENLKSSLTMQAKKQTSVLDANAGDAYTNISNRFQEILNWKATVEVSIKHKDAKIQELLKAMDTHRDSVHKLQLENERLSRQCAEELDMRKEVYQKFSTTRDLSLTLKNHVEDIKKQLNNAFESRDMVDKRERETMIKYQELISQFDALKLTHIQEVGTLKNTIEMHQQRVSEVELSYKAKFMEYNKEVEALSNALEQKQQEVLGCHEVMVESKAHFENMEKERELLKSEVANMRTDNDNHVKRIDELEHCVSMLEAEKRKLETDYQATCNAYNELQDTRAEIMDKLNKCETHYSEHIEKLHGLMTEVQNELKHEQQRLAEADNKCQQLEEQIAEIQAAKANLETQINDYNEEIKKQNAFVKEKEQEFQIRIAEMSAKENSLKLKLEDIQSEIDVKIEENHHLHSMCDELKKEILTLKEESEEIKMKLNEKESQNKVESEKATSLADQLMTTQKMYSWIQEQKDDLEIALKSKQDELLKEQEEIKKLRSSFEEMVSFKESEISNLQVQMLELKTHTLSVDNDCATVADKAKSLEDEIAKKNHELSTHKEEILKLMKLLEDGAASFTELEQKFSSVQQELQSAKADLEENKKGCGAHDKKIKEMESASKHKDTQIKTLEVNTLQMKKELHDQKIKYDGLQLEIKHSSEKISSLEKEIIEKGEELEKLKNELSKAKETVGSSDYMQEIERLKCEKNIYLSKWMELQKDHTAVMMEKGSEIIALKRQIYTLQQPQPSTGTGQSTNTVSSATVSEENKVISQARVNQVTSMNKLNSDADKHSIFQKSFSSMMRPKASNSFITLANKRPPFFKPQRKEDPFDTSGSDYMEVDVTPDGAVKLIPSQRAAKKAAIENKSCPSTPFVKKDQKNTDEKKENKMRTPQITPVVMPAETTLPNRVVTSTPIKKSSLLSPKIQCNVSQKKKVRFEAKSKKSPGNNSNNKENTVDSDFKKSAPPAKRKIYSPRNTKGKAVQSSNVTSGLSTDPFEPFFFE